MLSPDKGRRKRPDPFLPHNKNKGNACTRHSTLLLRAPPRALAPALAAGLVNAWYCALAMPAAAAALDVRLPLNDPLITLISHGADVKYVWSLR